MSQHRFKTVKPQYTEFNWLSLAFKIPLSKVTNKTSHTHIFFSRFKWPKSLQTETMSDNTPRIIFLLDCHTLIWE